MKATISKQTAEGELIVIEIQAKDAVAMAPQLVGAIQLTDARLMEMNQRVMQGHTYMKSLDPAIRGPVSMAVNSMMEILYGRVSPATQAAMQAAASAPAPEGASNE